MTLFHTHARFVHNDEIEKTFIYKKLAEDTELWICYFMSYFV